MQNRTLRMTVTLLAVGFLGLMGCSDDDTSGSECGNGTLETGEVCDGSALDGQSCTTVPGLYTGGTLACAVDCTFDVSGCTSGPVACGNDVQETGEACDGADFGGADCTDAGNYVGGTLGCTATCTFDTSQCDVDPNCGNATIDPNEECDTTDLAGQDCTTVAGGYTGGVLVCANDCTFDDTGCTMGGDPVQQIIDARAASDGTNLNLPIEGAWVTYVKAAVGNDPAGFFLQASAPGPALFVAVDPTTLTPQPAVGDAVNLTVTTMSTVDSMRQATEITGYSVTSSNHDVTLLAQEVSSATDLVTALDSYEVELLSVTGTIAGAFHFAGTGYQSARFETAGMVGVPELQLRVPDTILPAVGLDQGCEVQVRYTPLWRFDDRAQISVWATGDASLISCPAPVVLSATATGDSTVVVTISRAVDPASVLTDGSQFTFTHGLTASSATASGNEITVLTSARTPGEQYTVIVAQTVTDILGTGMAAPPDNQADFTGYILNLCGNATLDAGEDCDDGNRDSYDGCSSICHDEAGHLIISELVVTPSEGELIELYNPTANAISLDDVYLADFNAYYQITQGAATPQGSDFVVQFPSGHTVPAGGFVVVSTGSATEFHSVYTFFPDFDMVAADTDAPAMTGTIGANAGLTNSSEMLVLFTWDGSADLVVDLDYVLWGSNISVAMDKTGVTVGSGSYLAETATSAQASSSSPNGVGQSLERCDTSEGAESVSGGNGLLGHDETSEIFSTTFSVSTTPTPGAPPAAGTCGP